MTESDPDFWYLLGSDYEVIVFPSLAAAEITKVKLERDSGYSDYWSVREGRYGVEFSGWIGRQQEAEE